MSVSAAAWHLSTIMELASSKISCSIWPWQLQKKMLGETGACFGYWYSIEFLSMFLHRVWLLAVHLFSLSTNICLFPFLKVKIIFHSISSTLEIRLKTCCHGICPKAPLNHFTLMYITFKGLIHSVIGLCRDYRPDTCSALTDFCLPGTSTPVEDSYMSSEVIFHCGLTMREAHRQFARKQWRRGGNS